MIIVWSKLNDHVYTKQSRKKKMFLRTEEVHLQNGKRVKTDVTLQPATSGCNRLLYFCYNNLCNFPTTKVIALYLLCFFYPKIMTLTKKHVLSHNYNDLSCIWPALIMRVKCHIYSGVAWTKYTNKAKNSSDLFRHARQIEQRICKTGRKHHFRFISWEI